VDVHVPEAGEQIVLARLGIARASRHLVEIGHALLELADAEIDQDVGVHAGLGGPVDVGRDLVRVEERGGEQDVPGEHVLLVVVREDARAEGERIRRGYFLVAADVGGQVDHERLGRCGKEQPQRHQDDSRYPQHQSTSHSPSLFGKWRAMATDVTEFLTK
jgi:hypothetical protein